MLIIPLSEAHAQGVTYFKSATHAACLQKYRGKRVIKRLHNGSTLLLVENRDFILS